MPKGDKIKPLTDKRQAFVEEYCNNGYNASEAYKKAYPKVKSGWNKHASRLMTKDDIRQAIARAKASIRSITIASRMDRQGFWTTVANDDTVSMPDRLRASELLGRSEADFTDNIANTVEDQTKTLTNDEQIEALRDQIRLLDGTTEAGTAVAS
jgi:flavin-binding protein dodecin